MNQQQAEVGRRGFLKAACAAPALGLALDEARETLAGQAAQSSDQGPRSRSDEELKGELDEYGFVVMEELIPRQHALRAEERVKEIMGRQRDAAGPDQHLPGFLNHIEPSDDSLFLLLVTQPVCLKLARALLGDGFQMT